MQAEREQGITIDVAYRYFYRKRKFIIADTPGHEQYTRNMATGASTCDLAILLIDARKGVLDQTRRHSFISTLLGIKHLVVAVNKMDLVDYSEARFDEIRQSYLTFAEQLPGNLDIRFVPLSALEGITSPLRAGTCRGTAARRCWKCWKPLKFSAWLIPSRCASGAVREPSEPRFPRLLGHHCVRRGEGGPAREGAAVRCGIGHCPNRHL